MSDLQKGIRPEGLVRKWARYLWYSPIRRPIVAWNQRISHQFAEAYFASTPSRKKLLQQVRSSLSTGAGLEDYHFLHSYVVQKKPKKILELGSGVSSIIIAHAISELEDGRESICHLFSMEDIPFYHEDVKRLTPEGLRKHVTFQLSPREMVKWRNEISGYRYQKMPDEPFDLIFVDGPSDQVPMQSGVSLDAFYLLNEKFIDRPVDIVIDFRLRTCRAFQSVLPPGRVKFDPFSRLSTISSITGKEFLPCSKIRREGLTKITAWKNLSVKQCP